MAPGLTSSTRAGATARALFINNLARSHDSVLTESGGALWVEPRPECPPLPDWADPTQCWQAAAVVADGEVCMIIARGPGSLGFGQVGGDDMAGRLVDPPGWPECL